MIAGKFAAVQVMLLMIVVFFAVSGEARQLGGDVWAPTGEVVSGDGVAVVGDVLVPARELRAVAAFL